MPLFFLWPCEGILSSKSSQSNMPACKSIILLVSLWLFNVKGLGHRDGHVVQSVLWSIENLHLGHLCSYFYNPKTFEMQSSNGLMSIGKVLLVALANQLISQWISTRETSRLSQLTYSLGNPLTSKGTSRLSRLTLTHLTTASQRSLGCKSSCMTVWSCNLHMQNLISCNVQLICILDSSVIQCWHWWFWRRKAEFF